MHGMRMVAAMGRHLDRNGIPANADCRGAYHLRSAKISRPSSIEFDAFSLYPPY